MANPETMQVSAFPLPPSQYISAYTDDNVRKGKVPKPPPIPANEYKMFGKRKHYFLVNLLFETYATLYFGSFQ